MKADTVQMAFGSFSFCLFEMAFMIERRTLVPMVSEYEIETLRIKTHSEYNIHLLLPKENDIMKHRVNRTSTHNEGL